jgi:hypothetical protein
MHNQMLRGARSPTPPRPGCKRVFLLPLPPSGTLPPSEFTPSRIDDSRPAADPVPDARSSEGDILPRDEFDRFLRDHAAEEGRRLRQRRMWRRASPVLCACVCTCMVVRTDPTVPRIGFSMMMMMMMMKREVKERHTSEGGKNVGQRQRGGQNGPCSDEEKREDTKRQGYVHFLAHVRQRLFPTRLLNPNRRRQVLLANPLPHQPLRHLRQLLRVLFALVSRVSSSFLGSCSGQAMGFMGGVEEGRGAQGGVDVQRDVGRVLERGGREERAWNGVEVEVGKGSACGSSGLACSHARGGGGGAADARARRREKKKKKKDSPICPASLQASYSCLKLLPRITLSHAACLTKLSISSSRMSIPTLPPPSPPLPLLLDAPTVANVSPSNCLTSSRSSRAFCLYSFWSVTYADEVAFMSGKAPERGKR